jgi:hypothetical protein
MASGTIINPRHTNNFHIARECHGVVAGKMFIWIALQAQRTNVKTHSQRRPIVPRPGGFGTNDGSGVDIVKR